MNIKSPTCITVAHLRQVSPKYKGGVVRRLVIFYKFIGLPQNQIHERIKYWLQRQDKMTKYSLFKFYQGDEDIKEAIDWAADEYDSGRCIFSCDLMWQCPIFKYGCEKKNCKVHKLLEITRREL